MAKPTDHARFELNGVTFTVFRRGGGWSVRFWSRRRGTTVFRALRTGDLRTAEVRAHEIAILETKPAERAGDRVMVGDLLARDWHLHARHQESAETHRYVRRDFLGPAFGHLSVAELTLDRQEELRDQMLAEGYRPSYVSWAFSSLAGALRRAKQRHELTDYPAIIDIKRPEPREQRVLTAREIAALLEHAPPHLARFIWIAVATGARPEAILELTRPQVDLDHWRIAFNAPDRVQTRKRRVIAPVIDALAEVLAKPTGFYLIEFNGKPISSIKRALRSAAIRAGIDPKGLSPKSFRHTIAVELRRRGVPEWECLGLLGHRGTSRVGEMYARYRPDHLGEAAAAISAFVEAVRQGADNTPPDLVGNPECRVSSFAKFRPRTG
jgi:integrase